MRPQILSCRPPQALYLHVPSRAQARRSHTPRPARPQTVTTQGLPRNHVRCSRNGANGRKERRNGARRNRRRRRSLRLRTRTASAIVSTRGTWQRSHTRNRGDIRTRMCISRSTTQRASWTTCPLMRRRCSSHSRFKLLAASSQYGRSSRRPPHKVQAQCSVCSSEHTPTCRIASFHILSMHTSSSHGFPAIRAVHHVYILRGTLLRPHRHLRTHSHQVPYASTTLPPTLRTTSPSHTHRLAEPRWPASAHEAMHSGLDPPNIFSALWAIRCSLLHGCLISPGFYCRPPHMFRFLRMMIFHTHTHTHPSLIPCSLVSGLGVISPV